MSKPLLSRVRRVGNVLFLSGMIGRGDDKETRFRNTFERIRDTLEHVVNATVYLEDLGDRPTILNPLWREFFPENPPTRTCIQVGLLGREIEITAIAEIPG